MYCDWRATCIYIYTPNTTAAFARRFKKPPKVMDKNLKFLFMQ